MNVISPSKFHQRFTLYVNTNGQPVQRSLSEMTAGEVWQSLEWHAEEAMRLDDAAKPARETLQALEAGTLDPNSLSEATLTDCVAAARCAGLAHEATAHLWEQVRAILRAQWQHHPKMGVQDAIRRFWPGGR